MIEAVAHRTYFHLYLTRQHASRFLFFPVLLLSQVVMRPRKVPQTDVHSLVAQNEIVHQASCIAEVSSCLLLMLPLVLIVLSYALVVAARYDGSITLLHFNDLDGVYFPSTVLVIRAADYES